MPEPLVDLKSRITACRLCADRFAATKTAHQPRPVVWFTKTARILIAGQAPGARVHASGVPFDDPSGERLRDWMGLSRADFYDQNRVAILPMAFCFPGYTAQGADLPPPVICAKTWHTQVMAEIDQPDLVLLIGGYAHKWHLGAKTTVTETTRGWRAHAPRLFPLPHPSWRNTGWLKANPWFASDLLPDLRQAVYQAMHQKDKH